MNPRLEHANLTVRDIDATLAFLQAAFPAFRIRHDAIGSDGHRWVHVGTDEAYLALQQSTSESATPWVPYSGKPGVNHLAFEVDDVQALRERLRSRGYKDTTIPNAHPHRSRVYFHDPDGNDWEFVQYHSADRALRHDYRL